MAEGYLDFTAGAVLTAAQVEEYLLLQSTMRFATAAARDTALSAVLTEGLTAFLKDTNTATVYTGSAWSTTGPEHGAGNNWTPTVTQSGSVTVTTASATYFRLGRLYAAFFSVSVTGSGTGGNAIEIAYPFTNRSGMASTGIVQLTDSSTGAVYIGAATAQSSTVFRLRSTAGGGTFLGVGTFSDGLASGDGLAGFLIAEAATDA